jgi:hypothetical protein
MREPTIRNLRYPASCATCRTPLARGTTARWDYDAKQATCISCVEAEVGVQPPADLLGLTPDQLNDDVPLGSARREESAEAGAQFDRGVPGASAALEWTRRHERRERQVRARWGRLGRIAYALSEDPHSTNAWAYGHKGEAKLGKQLNAFLEEGMGVLHDRRIPGSKANIDHLVVAPSGVFVIDAKNYKGRVEKRDRGGWFSTDYRLYVGGRDKTPLIAGLPKQVDAVKTALADEFADIPVGMVLCFVDADWSLFANPVELGGAHILWPRALGKLIRTKGKLSRDTIAAIERQLALALPRA